MNSDNRIGLALPSIGPGVVDIGTAATAASAALPEPLLVALSTHKVVVSATPGSVIQESAYSPFGIPMKDSQIKIVDERLTRDVVLYPRFCDKSRIKAQCKS